MSNYSKTTDFAAKDSLPSGDAAKIIRGSEFETEFDNISTAIATKADSASPTFTGTVTIDGLTVSGNTTLGNAATDTVTVTADIASNLIPSADNTHDLGASGAEWKDLYVDGTAYVDTLDLNGTAVTSTATELNLLDGATVTTAEINILDGVTATTAEINLLDGVTSTTAELNILDGVTSTAAELNTLDGITSTTAELNILDGVTSTASELNLVDGSTAGTVVNSKAVVYGTSGEVNATTLQVGGVAITSTPAELNLLDGATVTTAEINILDGVTATTAELNLLDGVTATTAELNILDGVTSTATELNLLDGITGILDEDNMASNSATALATQQSIKAYVDSQVATADALSEVLGNGNTTGGTDIAVGTGDDITFADNSKAIFGAGSDLEIYHDGSNSYITDNGTGNLKIGGANVEITTAIGTKYFEGAANIAKLFHTGNQKLATTSTGIDVTGTVTSDGLTVEKSAARYVSLDLDTRGDNNGSVVCRDGSSGNLRNIDIEGQQIQLATNAFDQTASIPRMRVATNGDVLFYEDTGTTAKFYWDASAERLGIGTTSPSRPLHVNNNDGIRVGATASYQLDLKGAQTPAVTVGGSTLASVITTSGTGSASGHIGFEIPSNDTNDGFYIATDANNDGTVDTLALKINASGNVGIGTGSPATTLTVEGSSANGIELNRNGVDATSSARLFFDSSTNCSALFNSGGNFIIATGATPGSASGTERIRVDADGNVGIGTSSPSTALNVVGTVTTDKVEIEGSGAGLLNMYRTGTNANFSAITFNNSANTATNAKIGWNANELRLEGTTQMTFNTNSNEAMRITNGGHLLVGKTAQDATNTVGFEAKDTGEIGVTTDGTAAGYFNRKTSDGTIAEFRKDNSTVGNIKTLSISGTSRLTVGSGDVNLMFRPDIEAVQPASDTGVRDAAITLGNSVSRFKDLYLSGGAYLGGAVAANLLNDYEEGTFTPELADASSGGNTGTATTLEGRYTKVGRQIVVVIKIEDVDTTGMTGANNIFIRGLPFTAGSGTTGQSQGSLRLDRVDLDANCCGIVSSTTSNSTYLTLRQTVDNSADVQIKVQDFTSGSSDIFTTITYFE